MRKHKCFREFPTTKIDECCGTGSNTCEGIDDMTLDVWFKDQDGTECYLDNWMSLEVNYCPFCGMKANRYEEI